MIKPKFSRAEPHGRMFLVSKTFFSTLEYAAVPNAATDLFLPLVQQFQEEWDDIYKNMEQHLMYTVWAIFSFGDPA